MGLGFVLLSLASNVCLVLFDIYKIRFSGDLTLPFMLFIYLTAIWGCVIGWYSVKTIPGLVAAILGTLWVLVLVWAMLLPAVLSPL